MPQAFRGEDAIYHTLFYNVTIRTAYDLVLVDEAQDLNNGNHQFLRHCVVPMGSRSVLCAVGDPAQAIYQFRAVLCFDQRNGAARSQPRFPQPSA